MVATPAIAWAGCAVVDPAAVNASGTTTATPIPSSAKPPIASTGILAIAMRTAPAAASAPASRTVATTPSLATTVLPTSRPAAIAAANPV